MLEHQKVFACVRASESLAKKQAHEQKSYAQVSKYRMARLIEDNPDSEPIDRRITLLERANLDSDIEDNKQLLSLAEFTKLITDQPDKLLKEVYELIRQ